jgi:hypothetical protein
MENENQTTTTPTHPIQNTPSINSTPPKTPNLFLLILLGLILVTGSVLIGIQIGKNQNPPQRDITKPLPILPTAIVSNPMITPPAEGTSNWKTYTDSKYKFSFKYPNGWVTKFVSVVGYDDQVWIADKESSMPSTLPGQIGNGGRAPIVIQISLSDLSKNFSDTNLDQFESKSYQIGNLTGIYKTGISKASLSRETIISVKTGTNYLNIIPLDTENNKLNLDQILSSFKFGVDETTSIPTPISNLFN